MKQLLRPVALLLSIALLLSVPALAAVPTGQTEQFAQCLAETTLRPAPDSSTALAELSAGKTVLVLSRVGAWACVSYGGQIGYLPSVLLDTLEDGSYTLGVGFVRQADTLVYKNPWAGEELLAKLDLGTALAVTGIYGAWYQLGNAAGEIVGYVLRASILLQNYPESEADAALLQNGSLLAADTTIYLGQETATAALAQDLVQTALTFEGCRYSWGSSGPTSFDCSGFVNYVYSLYGYSLERVACNIYKEDGLLIEDASQLQPGDILCFREYVKGSYICHVGIYVGDGQFIHASSSRGRVILTSLSQDYYTQRFAGAKRILGV